MFVFKHRCEANAVRILPKILRVQASQLQSESTEAKQESKEDLGEFRVLRLIKPKESKAVYEGRKTPIKRIPPRTHVMPVDQDWPTVWPGPRTFNASNVPLPLRQGYKRVSLPPPGKYGNLELMKVPNFLHLTPPAVKRQCEALKRFCTKWPDKLDSEEAYDKYFPVRVTTSDYCYSSPSIREPLARIVTLQVKMSSLHLDSHARDKMLRLLGDRYNPETDLITIVTDRCPVRKQNLDYAKYLLTVLFHESWRVEDWEAEKSKADMEFHDWDKSKSRENLIAVYAWPQKPSNLDYTDIPHGETVKLIVTDLVNKGESPEALDRYKAVVTKILNLSNENQV